MLRCSQIRFVFAFADTHQELAIKDDAMKKLLRAIFVSAKGLGNPSSMLLAVPRLKHTAGGFIPVTEFAKFCAGAPALLFPTARLQVCVHMCTSNLSVTSKAAPK